MLIKNLTHSDKKYKLIKLKLIIFKDTFIIIFKIDSFLFI